MLWVLIISSILAIIVLTGVWGLYNPAMTHAQAKLEQSQAASVRQPAPTSSTQ